MKLRALSVSELNKYIKKIISSDPILNNVVVKGEISNIKYHSSGHIYLSLKDENSKIHCIIFKEHALKIKFQAVNGMKVIIKGYVSTFDRDGQYQIYINSMEPDGLGALYMAYEQLKNKLESEGLFDKYHKKKIPFFPLKIAVVTSPTGAAIRDIISVIKRRNHLVNIVIYPVLVQGENAAVQIADAINKINMCSRDAEVIILGRGGGSIEELWAFNEEIVARSIFKSTIPIISAVGHETDYTISDFVADFRAPTPSAAAEIAAPNIADIKNRLSNANVRLNNLLEKSIKIKKNNLHLLSIEKIRRVMDRTIKGDQHSLQMIHKELQNNVELTISSLKTALTQNASKLEAMNPLSTLLRGYAIVVNEDSVPVTKIENVHKDDYINIMLTNGMINCSVISTKREGNILEQYFK